MSLVAMKNSLGTPSISIALVLTFDFVLEWFINLPSVLSSLVASTLEH